MVCGKNALSIHGVYVRRQRPRTINTESRLQKGHSRGQIWLYRINRSNTQLAGIKRIHTVVLGPGPGPACIHDAFLSTVCAGVLAEPVPLEYWHG